ncbi:DUF5665 domain-containing protein [Pacificoceanicola onchidii]|uniref:DUF5665 domain-containing protein n=1 Tax=Pacificoceanicola onchidii TaxID=2562685 RepID=UPI0010A61AF1|nr:DUF5665 domain-containing protein [Pacificoceanicola onchidii]
MPSDTEQSQPLQQEISRLTTEVQRLNQHRFIRVQNSVPRLILFQFVRGLAFGLGTVVGASALVSIIVLLLSQVEFIPILGDLATQIIQEIQPPGAE